MTLTDWFILAAAVLCDGLLLLAFAWVIGQAIRAVLPPRAASRGKETAAVRDGGCSPRRGGAP